MSLAAVYQLEETQAPPEPEFTPRDQALLWKVCHYVNRTRCAGRRDPGEFLGAAWCGWHEARQRFDPARGVTFAAFAFGIIRGRVLDEIRSQLPLTRTVRGMLRQYNEQSLLGEPSQPSAEKAEQGRTAQSKYVFREALARQECEAAPLEQYPDPAAGQAHEEMLARLSVESIRQYCREGGLVRDKCLVVEGLLSDMPMKDIGQALGISESRVSQLAAESVWQLRRHFDSPGGGFIPFSF